jgi:hypothetical protein
LDAIIVVLYAVTWIGGWTMHDREVKALAQRLYDDAERHNREIDRALKAQGIEEDWRRPLLEGGPAAGVDWCIPILPGVLLSYSHFVIAPLWGQGEVEIVIYYGYGSTVVLSVLDWIS